MYFCQFLSRGSLRDIQLDDLKDFERTDQAMSHMGMNDNEKMAIYTIVAGVLHLGNVTFEEDENSTKGMRSLLCYLNVCICKIIAFF